MDECQIPIEQKTPDTGKTCFCDSICVAFQAGQKSFREIKITAIEKNMGESAFFCIFLVTMEGRNGLDEE